MSLPVKSIYVQLFSAMGIFKGICSHLKNTSGYRPYIQIFEKLCYFNLIYLDLKVGFKAILTL